MDFLCFPLYLGSLEIHSEENAKSIHTFFIVAF